MYQNPLRPPNEGRHRGFTGPQTYKIINSFLGTFRLDSALLSEGIFISYT